MKTDKQLNDMQENENKKKHSWRIMMTLMSKGFFLSFLYAFDIKMLQ